LPNQCYFFIREINFLFPLAVSYTIRACSTDINLSPEKIIAWYIQRWNLEVTFEEVREHLGVETQRQWSDKAIARTTPILLGLYTIVCLIANKLHVERPIEVAQTA
jgi:hypothetical protein